MEENKDMVQEGIENKVQETANDIIISKVGDASSAAAKKVGGKLVIKLIGVAVTAVAVFFGVRYFSHNFSSGVRIMDTPTVVQEIKKIAELTSAIYVEDVVIRDTIVKYHDESKLNISGLISEESFIKKQRATDKILFVQVATGRIKAGFDLTKVGDGDVLVTDSVLTIVLPPAQILDVIMNPSDIRPFYDEKSGDWTEQEIHEAKTQILNKALDKIKFHAIDEGILLRAEAQGITRLKAMFTCFGFKQVVITIKEQ